ncbi:MAG: MarR family transcriptional regulator [Gammaproteobacteria bacterium]|nr:MarR family transcriptional regulator [Gammaproteobacteria bacterium]
MTSPISRQALIRLSNFVPYRLATLSNKISSAIAVAYSARFSLNIPQWRILCILAEHPGISAREVAEKTAMDKVAVSRAVNQLLDRELLRRNFDSGDRRRSILELSDAGFEVYNQVAPYALEYERRLLSEMTEEDVANLDRAIDALNASADKISKEEEL